MSLHVIACRCVSLHVVACCCFVEVQQPLLQLRAELRVEAMWIGVCLILHSPSRYNSIQIVAYFIFQLGLHSGKYVHFFLFGKWLEVIPKTSSIHEHFLEMCSMFLKEDDSPQSLTNSRHAGAFHSCCNCSFLQIGVFAAY